MCDKEKKKKKKKRKFGPPLVSFRAREWALLTRGGGDESHVSRGGVDWGQRPTFISALRS